MKTTLECNYVSEKNCREVSRVGAPVWEKVCDESYCTQNLRISRVIFKIQGLFKELLKMPLKFKDFSRISRTCLKFKDFKEIFKDVVTLQKCMSNLS